MRLATLLLVLLSACAGPRIMICDQAQDRLALMAADEDWADPAAVKWQWTASDSPEIPANHHSWFAKPTDAKPVLGGDFVLLTASGGGVALIRLSDKAVLFHANPGGNPHSAEMLPDGAIATASSTGNSLQLWRLSPYPQPLQTVELPNAHGLCWDHNLMRLWVIGGDQLYSFKYAGTEGIPPLVYERQYALPGPGGHDLQRRALTNELILTTTDGCWTFNPASEIFSPHPLLHSHNRIKSTSEAPQRAPAGSPTLFIQAEESWWSDTVNSADGNWSRTLEKSEIYKARWWYERTKSKAFRPQIGIAVGVGGLLGLDPE